MNPKEQYIFHTAALEKLHNIPKEKQPQSLGAATIVREEIAKHEIHAQAAFKRLTYDQKKEMGLLESQRTEWNR